VDHIRFASCVQAGCYEHGSSSAVLVVGQDVRVSVERLGDSFITMV
jgi:hypothetical protein